jgi:hypothetical protein
MAAVAKALRPAWTITLPYPPSVNRLWRYTSRGVYRTKVYTDWLRCALGAPTHSNHSIPVLESRSWSE